MVQEVSIFVQKTNKNKTVLGKDLLKVQEGRRSILIFLKNVAWTSGMSKILTLVQMCLLRMVVKNFHDFLLQIYNFLLQICFIILIILKQ